MEPWILNPAVKESSLLISHSLHYYYYYRCLQTILLSSITLCSMFIIYNIMHTENACNTSLDDCATVTAQRHWLHCQSGLQMVSQTNGRINKLMTFSWSFALHRFASVDNHIVGRFNGSAAAAVCRPRDGETSEAKVLSVTVTFQWSRATFDRICYSSCWHATRRMKTLSPKRTNSSYSHYAIIHPHFIHVHYYFMFLLVNVYEYSR